MDNEADHAAEYERLRAELADFVVGALGERVAAGDLPQLSQALADAIDRRVEQAVQARLGQVQWPDPDAFADQVIAAAAARGIVEGEPSRSRARTTQEEARRARPRADAGAGAGGGAIGGWSWLQVILAALVGVAVVAAATYFLFSRTAAPTRSETINNVTFVTPEPTPDGGNTLVLPPPADGAEPLPPAAPVHNETRRR